MHFNLKSFINPLKSSQGKDLLKTNANERSFNFNNYSIFLKNLIYRQEDTLIKIPEMILITPNVNISIKPGEVSIGCFLELPIFYIYWQNNGHKITVERVEEFLGFARGSHTEILGLGTGALEYIVNLELINTFNAEPIYKWLLNQEHLKGKVVWM